MAVDLLVQHHAAQCVSLIEALRVDKLERLLRLLPYWRRMCSITVTS